VSSFFPAGYAIHKRIILERQAVAQKTAKVFTETPQSDEIFRNEIVSRNNLSSVSSVAI
jgi:hypothetical protein